MVVRLTVKTLVIMGKRGNGHDKTSILHILCIPYLIESLAKKYIMSYSGDYHSSNIILTVSVPFLGLLPSLIVLDFNKNIYQILLI